MNRHGKNHNIALFNELFVGEPCAEIAHEYSQPLRFKNAGKKTSHKSFSADDPDCRLCFHGVFDYIKALQQSITMKYIDTHSHLHVEEFDIDRNEVIERARTAGVALINVGFEHEGNKKAAALAALHDDMWWTAGIHPHNADEATDKALQWIIDAAASPAGKKLVALGEMGLDYFKNRQPRELQRIAFHKQLKLAKQLNLPVIVHCRDAFDDAMDDMLTEEITRAVFHCFTGTVEEAKRAWERGYLTSFTGICTYTSAENVRAVIREAPLDKIMIESDCPFLAPQSHRGERNEPAFLPEIAAQIASIHQKNIIELEGDLSKNTNYFYRLS